MATKGKATGRELATLALAKAVIERDDEGFGAALDGGGDPDAFWIDGSTSLRELAGERGTAAMAKALARPPEPEEPKTFPSMADAPELWSADFAVFLAMRGYKFAGRTNPLAGGGSELRGLDKAKSAVRLIANKWSLVETAHCLASVEGEASQWRLRFRADWKGDRRIVGFDLEFVVDAGAWQLAQLFETARSEGTEIDWPEPTARLLSAQKDWEGENIVYNFICDHYGLDELIEVLRKGGSPFLSLDGKLIGEAGGRYEGDAETQAFMATLREELGPREGWHLRIVPLLTKEGVEALRVKAALRRAVPEARKPRKSLKSRADIV